MASCTLVAGLEIAEKSYTRVQRLFDEGVMTAQKRDEALANYKAFELWSELVATLARDG